jgi:dTDP-4-amino-4,6-dideoxygalactose transaminase
LINVTKPYLPDLETYKKYIDQIWESGQLTNNGKFCKRLEKEICNYLSVSNCIYVNNGTIALQIALKTLGHKKNEIITTPFSYVATTNAIIWEGFSPVFCDINNTDYCIDTLKIEEKINENTVAILATHVFGNPCDVEKIRQIGKKYNLKIIYDGAHAFGTYFNNKPLLEYGDISICSFHATKLFHTVEGGCIIANDASLIEKMVLFRQFGHVGDSYLSVGINGKSSELHAAMGLCVLPEINNIVKKRKEISETYDNELSAKLVRPLRNPLTNYNYAYYPISLKDENQLKQILDVLNNEKIFPRRYFYPSLNTLPFLSNSNDCPVSEEIAKTILCLPIYFDLKIQEVRFISHLINKSL